MTPTQLLDLLFANLPLGDGSDVRSFLKGWGDNPQLPSELGISPTHDETVFDRLVWVALRGDRRSMAAAAGHQAAIRRLFPQTPSDAITAICISEDQGPRPSKIKSALTRQANGDWVLNGSKRWGTMAPDADVLYVAASIGFKENRNQLRMIALPADRAGIAKDLSPYADRNRELRICDLGFDNVAIEPAEIIDADAYDAYIKPFRLIEDVYGTAATQIVLFQLGRRNGWSETLLEDLAGLVLQARNVARTDMASPTAVLLMSSYLRAANQLWEGIGSNWDLVPAAEREAWSPQSGLLEVAARARETRRQNAWADVPVVA